MATAAAGAGSVVVPCSREARLTDWRRRRASCRGGRRQGRLLDADSAGLRADAHDGVATNEARAADGLAAGLAVDADASAVGAAVIGIAVVVRVVDAGLTV